MRRAGPAAAYPPGTVHELEGDPPLALYRLADGTFRASELACPHYFWSLAETGELDGAAVVCTAHDARFDLDDGRVLCGPGRTALRVHPVCVDADGVVVVVDDAALAP